MNQNQNLYYYQVMPGEHLSDEIKAELKKINDRYSNTKNFQKYIEDIRTLFKLPAVENTAVNKFFLGGFIEGEGSVNVSAKKHKNAKFGFMLDPEFSITQHINGVSNLYNALSVFKTGRIRFKEGSNSTMSFIIDNRESLLKKVIPFYEKYITPNGSFNKKNRLENFKQLLILFDENCHQNLDCFVNKMLPLWDHMRIQKDQVNTSFNNLEEAIFYAKNFVAFKEKK